MKIKVGSIILLLLGVFFVYELSNEYQKSEEKVREE